ncbi:hypothetical protein LCGC14_3146070 [marine sediment metagenome]|uniref:Uncharacterized protein n=1 Tax=marine sediment metagenome TaxID=412755 RepID=A0A0F8YJQ4_9ZZZZ
MDEELKWPRKELQSLAARIEELEQTNQAQSATIMQLSGRVNANNEEAGDKLVKLEARVAIVQRAQAETGRRDELDKLVESIGQRLEQAENRMSEMGSPSTDGFQRVDIRGRFE